MHINDIQADVYTALRAAPGQLLDAHQVHAALTAARPELAEQLHAAYAYRRYSPASFVANALRHFARRDPRVVQHGEHRNGRWVWQGEAH